METLRLRFLCAYFHSHKGLYLYYECGSIKLFSITYGMNKNICMNTKYLFEITSKHNIIYIVSYTLGVFFCFFLFFFLNLSVLQFFFFFFFFFCK